MTIRIAALTAASLVLLAGCGLVTSGGASLDGDWRLESGTVGAEPIPVLDRAPITMTIDGGTLSGIAACNHYGGEIAIDGEAVTIGAMSMTEMGCDEPVMSAESAYISALTAVDSHERSGDRLALRGGDVELRYRLVPAVADAPLAGPTWVLDSLISGDVVSSVMGDEATLELREDGTFSGTTGCRTFDGSFEADGDAVRVEQLVNDDRACPDELVAQDEHVLGVLADGFTFEISGRRLTLADGDTGLGYVARE